MRETAGKTYYDLEQQGYTHDGIAQRYRIKPSSVRRQIALYKQSLQIGATSVAAQVASPVTPIPAQNRASGKIVGETDPIGGCVQPLPEGQSADARRAAYQAYLGSTLDKFSHVPARPSPRRKIVAIGDLHGAPAPAILSALIPYQPDMILFGGDLLDQRQASAHGASRADRQRTLRAEMAAVRAFLEALRQQLPAASFLIQRGNHDDWAFRKAADLLPPYLLEFFTDPLDVLLADLPGVARVRMHWTAPHPGGGRADFGESEYLYRLGDALFSHANFTSGQPGGAVIKLHNWLYGEKGWADYLDLPPIRVLCQFHGHKIAHLKPHGGTKHWIEPGMACEPFVEAYKAEYKTNWGPGALGGLYLEQVQAGEAWTTETVQLFGGA